MNTIILSKKTDNTTLIEKTEKQLGVVVPSNIIDFLKENNRGIPKEKGLYGVDESIFVTRFISISERDAVNMFSLAQKINHLNGDIAYIPIALDGYGNLFCLMYENQNEYSVVYLSLEQHVVVPICEDFKEFLRRMNL